MVGIFVTKNMLNISAMVCMILPIDDMFSIQVNEKTNVIMGKIKPGHLLFPLDRNICNCAPPIIKTSKKITVFINDIF